MFWPRQVIAFAIVTSLIIPNLAAAEDKCHYSTIEVSTEGEDRVIRGCKGPGLCDVALRMNPEMQRRFNIDTDSRAFNTDAFMTSLAVLTLGRATFQVPALRAMAPKLVELTLKNSRAAIPPALRKELLVKAANAAESDGLRYVWATLTALDPTAYGLALTELYSNCVNPACLRLARWIIPAVSYYKIHNRNETPAGTQLVETGWHKADKKISFVVNRAAGAVGVPFSVLRPDAVKDLANGTKSATDPSGGECMDDMVAHLQDIPRDLEAYRKFRANFTYSAAAALSIEYGNTLPPFNYQDYESQYDGGPVGGAGAANR